MNQYYPYVDDAILTNEVKYVINNARAKAAKTEISLHKNVVDPFSALFDSVTNDYDFEEWVEKESERQLQKTLQNSIGYFHQNIVGSMHGWEDMGRNGIFDVRNSKEKIIAEIKNKHNTFNSNSRAETYDKLAEQLDGAHKGYQGYVVLILPKKPERYSKEFFSNGKNTKRVARKDLLEIDGASFYELASGGDKEALKKLFYALPRVVEDIYGKRDDFELSGFIDLFNRAIGD